MFGCGAVAQLVLSGGSHGLFLTVNFSFGFAATLGILVCGQVSGTQLHLHLPLLNWCFHDRTRVFYPRKPGVCRAKRVTLYNTVSMRHCRRSSEPCSDLCPLPAGERALEKVPHVLSLSDDRRLLRGRHHFRHVLWYVTMHVSLRLQL